MKVVVVGGVAGGASCAARLRRLDEQAEIVVIERSGYVSYANCGLPYYVGGVIKNRKNLTLQTPQSFKDRFCIDVRVRQEVVRIDREAHEVEVKRLDEGTTYRERYDKLVLSPGARPIVLDVPGVDAKRLFTLRTVEDTLALSQFITDVQPQTAAVVGGGFIGIEAAENLCERGIAVTMYQWDPQVLPILDEEMAHFVHNHLREKGIDLRLGARVQGFENDERTISVADESGSQPFDLVVLAVGVLPETTLAAEAGLALGVKGAIVVDEHLLTSDPDIYAVGDAVQVKNYVTHADAHIALAGPANKQGRIVADNICGRDSTFDGSLGSSVLKVFDLTVAATGLTSRAAAAAGIDAGYVLLNPPNHASYYPGSSAIRFKVVFDRKTGAVLGAQAIGTEGVEKRVDVIATAIHGHLSVWDLAELDLCYAPPFSSAKDPVNMAGFMASNLMNGLVDQVGWDRALAPAENEIVLDARTDAEYARGHIDGALHIPLDELRDRLDELPKDKRLLVHCLSGLRSYLACRILSQHGFACANVAGGWVFYQAAASDVSPISRGVGPCGL